MHDYDLLVIGSGPGGQKAAIAAAKLDRRVAVVERPEMLGGVCLNTGTIPSKTLREAILYLTGVDQREIYGQSYRVKDGIIHLEQVPRSMVVAGAGVIGIEYASMFAALGTKVTVVERRDRMLEFCDEEVVEALKYHLRDLAVTFRFGGTVASVEAHQGSAIALPHSGKKIPADTVLYSAGRQGMTEKLDLDAAGLAADHRGRIAAHHACGEPVQMHDVPQPIGIYSIRARRGQIVGDSYGVLKLLVSPEDRTLLGVHAFGTGATELIHIGQAVMGCGGTVDYLVDAVFNYPTLSESYKVAALDATNKMRQVTKMSQ